MIGRRRFSRLSLNAVALRNQVDDRRIARLAFGHRDDAEREQHQQQPEIDRQRQGEARDAPLERRTVVRGREAIGGQWKIRQASRESGR